MNEMTRMNETKVYQPHEFAKIVGLTKRALRYYNEQGILLPAYVDEKGYKYYTEKSFFEAQRILSLRFLQFSIEEIKEMEDKHSNIEDSIKLQKQMLQEKIEQIQEIIDTLSDIETTQSDNGEIRWEDVFNAVKCAKCQRVYEKMMSYYDERAQEYDEIYEGKGPATFKQSAYYTEDVRQIEALATDFGKGKLIDIACGSGYWTKLYMDKCKSFTFLDQSSRMLEECRKKVCALKIEPQSIYIHADILDYEFSENEKYDSAIVGFLLGHFSKAKERRFFEKIRMILNHESQILIIENTWNAGRAKTKNKEDITQRKLDNGKTYEIYKRYFDEHELDKLLQQYGFEIEKTYFGKTFVAVIGRML